ncbi:hypothetical protein MKS88_003591 [Plasmodium brasilianum]|uniref:Uncharacterized protein n=2 Tax=Plasmodium (Plasmodium) TaxID=418103 RepID=A0A1A8W1M8_PLAMA|nr:conserved Plasmodium protein, unknown function [Plasmodium malariae]KAI4837121.1 hypothetical protein MKS88_003591 [Plasmodium brasilianum]SBS86800.1 hypothetical protein, conserved [Plasmodium malariae]SCO93005.1 conserved Plasmodium protein, unknown function [Plasmodium malariae]
MSGNNENYNGIRKEKTNELSNESILNDENIISICITNVLKSSLERNLENEDFLNKKNEELTNFIESNGKDNISVNEEKDKYGTGDDLEFVNVINNKPFLNNEHKIKNWGETANEGNIVYNPSINILADRKKNNKRKRNYLNINKINFDFEKEDFACSSSDELISLKYTRENELEGEYGEEFEGEYVKYYTNVCTKENINNYLINMNNETIRSLIEPPPIPFNETFQKYNKEISDIFMKYKKNDDTLNIYLASQLLCIEENAFTNENNFISSNFDQFIMKKLNVVNPTIDNTMNQNKDLQELLKYLMSWYFSGYYSGKMSVLKELHK